MLVDIIYFAFKLVQLEYLLFSVYLLLLTWLVLKLPFLKRSGLTHTELIVVFWSKILAGVVYGLVGIYYKITKGGIGRDTWRFHMDGLKESAVLKSHPAKFFSDLNNNYPDGYTGFFSSHNSWWNDIHDTLFVKFLAILDIFSFGNYYINVIFYSFIVLFAPVLIFKIFTDAYPGNRQGIFIGAFYIPSVLYWTSGIHKDGLIFLALTLIIGGFYFLLKKKPVLLNVIPLLVGAMMLLLLRNYLLVILIPAFIAWFIARRLKISPIIIFSACYLVFGVIFFTARHINDKLNFPSSVVQKQHDFLVLVGQSAVPVKKLEPTMKSFAVNAPQAFNLAVLQPSIGKIRSVFILPAFLEMVVLIALLFLMIFFHKKITISAFTAFCIFYALSVLLAIGYTVNIIGAIVRYRSIVLVYLVIPLIVSVNWTKVKQIYRNVI
jgi:hypothetical protein